MWNEIKIIDREKQWRIRELIESNNIGCLDDPISKQNININSMWIPLIRKQKAMNLTFYICGSAYEIQGVVIKTGENDPRKTGK